MLIPSLRIENFRVFRELSVEGLGDVNLITGRNNVGKTALLEAVRLFVGKGSLRVLVDLLDEHEEFDRSRAAGSDSLAALDIRAVFHGRPLSADEARLAVSDGRDVLELRLKHESFPVPGAQLGSASETTIARVPVVAVTGRGEPSKFFAVALREQLRQGVDRDEAAPSVTARGLSSATMASWWDKVSLTDGEGRVLECLQLAAPVERVAFIDVGKGRVPMVRLREQREPVPLRSLGEGMTRLFSFALAIERARESGVLLIDEIENGVHYAVLPDLWRFLFAAARANKVQVFATTHSWDCIAAFAEVAAEDRESVGALVRLREKQGTIVPTVFNEQDLKVIEREHVEVR